MANDSGARGSRIRKLVAGALVVVPAIAAAGVAAMNTSIGRGRNLVGNGQTDSTAGSKKARKRAKANSKAKSKSKKKKKS